MSNGIRLAFAGIGVVAASLLTLAMLLGFQLPPALSVQHGFRGTGMDQVYHPSLLADLTAENKVPVSLPQASGAGPRAGTTYKNVKVLGDLSVGQFTRLMVTITTWVAPKQGCAYCHNTTNMADDSLYTKIVARRMIQMVQNINGNWKSHVAATGVTCYTCHRGNPVPSQIWFDNPGPAHASGMAEAATGRGLASTVAGDASLPYDPFTPFLEHDHSIRAQGTTALPTDNDHSINEAEWTYALMIHFSNALGVNCTYCHNSRDFGDWSTSTPQRVTAWYGIRMVRNINNAYLDPLHGVFPAYRLGPLGDSAKVNCATCHQGVYKPLFGVSMLQGFPELRAPGAH
jgi:photosynthetic reaction center cytochrome c subunit